MSSSVWEEAVRAAYAETYLATLTLTMSTAAAQEATLARIAKGIEAARKSDETHSRLSLIECGCGVPMNVIYWRTHRDAAALAAFKEAG